MQQSLDPRFCQLSFLTNEQKIAVKVELLRITAELDAPSNSVDTPACAPLACSKPQKDSF